MVEDSSNDALLIDAELRKSGLSYHSKRIEAREEFLAELEFNAPDLILLDHGLPAFDGFSALAIAREKLPDVPLIFVTGSLGEETVLKTLQRGATDYVLKHNLSDLVPAVHRALRHAEERAKRRQAEAALRQSEERFRLLVENIADSAIFMLDAAGRIATWNSGAERLKGYRAEEIIGQSIAVLHQSEEGTDNKARRMLRTAALTGRYQEEGWRLRKDGSRFWAHIVITPLRNEARQLYGFTKVVRDINDRKRGADALRESEARYRRLVELSPDALLMHSEDRIVFVNPAAMRLLGATCPVELIGLPLETILHPEFEELERERIRRLNDKETEFNPFLEQKILRLDGGAVEVEAASCASRFHEHPAVQVILHDITGRKQAETQLCRWNLELEQRVAERTAQLEAANQELEAFSYSVSHDLRAPLRHIEGFIHILRGNLRENLNDTSQRALDTIAGAAQKMGRLIEELLEFSRMSRAEMRHATADLTLLVEKARLELRPDWEPRQVTWSIGPLPSLRGDPEMLRQVMINLLSNALKYSRTRAETRIEVASYVSGHETVVFVRDNGVGFDPQYAHKLFGVFQRLHSDRDFDGTGIGLAIVRRVIARHGGRTWAEGTLDRGATFYFALPTAQDG